MPAKSETFLLKFSFTDTNTGDTVEREGVSVVYPDDIIDFDEVLTATSDPVRGDGYYGRADGFHTVQLNLLGFVGTLKIQATLAIEPSETDWFTILENEYNLTSTPGVEESVNALENFTGNYVHIRARLENWSDGSVESIYLNH